MPRNAINTKAILLILIQFFVLVVLYNVYQLSLLQQRNDCADKSAQPSLSQVKQDKSAQPSLSQVKHQDQQDGVYNYTYAPSSAEKYIRFNAEELGFSSEKNPKGCHIWEDPNVTNADIHSGLVSYASEVNEHAKAVKNFKPIPDLLKSIVKTGNHSVCDTAKLHEDGLQALFPSKQLSLTNSGHVEPLLPPMRSQKFCHDESHLMSLDYLVHDFEAMCRKLKPTSKRILIDMGASLSFHGNSNQPIVTLLELYEKFGFNFDHIYGFEITFTEPKTVYEQLLPLKYFPNYHWINVGVSHDKEDKLNPLLSILRTFDEDDFIVVKLDIDTSHIELPLAKQLLEGGKDGIYHKLVDQFYFEHHVHLDELAPWWGGSMKGTVQETLDLFGGLREKGIPAHFWP